MAAKKRIIKNTKSKLRKKKTTKREKVILTYDQKKARWRIDPRTGKALSRYSYEKKYGRKGTRANHRQITNKFKRYIDLRDSYIEKQNQKRIKKGLKPLTKREAMNSEELKQIIVDLHRGMRLKTQGKIKQGNKLMRDALKKTTRRDGIPDNIPVGETPTQNGSE